MSVESDALPQQLQSLLADLVKAEARAFVVVPPLDAHQLDLSALQTADHTYTPLTLCASGTQVAPFKQHAGYYGTPGAKNTTHPQPGACSGRWRLCLQARFRSCGVVLLTARSLLRRSRLTTSSMMPRADTRLSFNSRILSSSSSLLSRRRRVCGRLIFSRVLHSEQTRHETRIPAANKQGWFNVAGG